jgi:hypothetical protein
MYGSRAYTDVIQVACGTSGIWEKLPVKRIAVPLIADVLKFRREYLIT